MITPEPQPSVPISTPIKTGRRKWRWPIIGIVLVVIVWAAYTWIAQTKYGPYPTTQTTTVETAQVIPVTDSPAIVPEVEPSNVTVQIVRAEYADASLAAYSIMADGSWNKIGSWQRAANEDGGIILTGTPTTGVLSIWRTTLGDTALIDGQGSTIDASKYPLFADYSGMLWSVLPFGNGTYLTSGRPSDKWPVEGAKNTELYLINEAAEVQKTWSLDNISSNSLDGLRLHGVSADEKFLYASVAGYEGNMADVLWKINLENESFAAITADQKMSDGVIAYGHVTVSVTDGKALVVEGAVTPCNNCFGESQITGPATVMMIDLATGSSVDVLESETYLPQVMIPAAGKVGYIYTEKAEQSDDGSITGYSPQKVWQVTLATGELKEFDTGGVVRGMSASGRYLLVAKRDSAPISQNVIPSVGYSIFDTVTGGKVALALFPDENPNFSGFMDCPQRLGGACLPN